MKEDKVLNKILPFFPNAIIYKKMKLLLNQRIIFILELTI